MSHLYAQDPALNHRMMVVESSVDSRVLDFVHQVTGAREVVCGVGDETVHGELQIGGSEVPLKNRDKNLKIDSRQDGDHVELSARETMHWNWGVHVSRGLRLEVRMPRNADLSVDSGDGSVEAQAVNGNVDIHTGDGHIKVEGAKGQIKLRTGDGSIEGRDLDGKIEADSGDGHITLDGRFDTLNIRTGDGSINAHAQPGSKVLSAWTIRTGDGSVDLTVPTDLNANIDASTNDGRISLAVIPRFTEK